MLKKYRPIATQDNPFMPISSETSLIFKTGAQRSERPVFMNKIAPCRHACPIGIDIPLAFHLASQGDIQGALRVYLQDNPLPGICGRVCYHPCEQECNRGSFDEPVAIRSFERFLSDHGRADILKDVPIHSRGARIAVIGSGPAGLSAAYHLAQLGYRITIFEGRSKLGGMLRYGIPAYRLPRSVLDREIERIRSLGIETHLDTTVGREVSWKDLVSFDAVFLSVGLQSGNLLFETHEESRHTLTGLDFLADPYTRSLEDSALKTLVIGGGNVAIDVARTLVRLRQGNGENITVICPESRDQMPALPEEIIEAEEEGITILTGWAPGTLHQGQGVLRSLDFFPAKVTTDEVSGEAVITRVGKNTQNREVDRIIVAIGQQMKRDTLPPGIELQRGRIAVDRFGRTSVPNMFAGGDATGDTAFVADAIASGKMGAFATFCFLEGRDTETEFYSRQLGISRTFDSQHLLEVPENNTVDRRRVVSFDQLNTLFFSPSARNNPDKIEPETRKKTSDEVVGGLTPGEMKEEISRCFHCGTCIDCEICLDFCPDISIIKDAKRGVYRFDADYCKGCGVCSVACPRNIIEMVAETP